MTIYLERLDQTSEMLQILETDAPTVRLLKAKTYLTAAGELLRRVTFIVVSDTDESSVNLKLKISIGTCQIP